MAVNLTINIHAALIICVECRSCISRVGLERHLSRKHHYGIQQVRLATRAIGDVLDPLGHPSISYLNRPPNTPLPPIQGLPIMNGLACLACSYHTAHLDTMRRHWARIHTTLPIPPSFPSTFIQSLSNSQGTACFPVSFQPPSTSTTPSQQQIHNLLHSAITAEGPHNEAPGSEEASWLPKFVQKTGWIEAIGELDWHSLRSVLSFHDNHDPFHSISYNAVKSYLSFCHGSIRDLPYDARLLFGTVHE